MSPADGYVVHESDDTVRVGVSAPGEPGVGRKAKAVSGTLSSRKLADISNLPQQRKPLTQNEKSQLVSAKEYIEQLQEEKMTLMKLLEDKNKMIGLTGNELRKLKFDLQSMQQQNLQLAQSNSQMLAELNSGKDKLKLLRHELACTKGLLKAKMLESQFTEKACMSPKSDDHKTRIVVQSAKCKGIMEPSQPDRDSKVARETKKLRQSKSHCLCSSQDREKVENKRHCARSQSARFRSQELKSSEHSFELEDSKSSAAASVDDQTWEDGSCKVCSSVKKEEGVNSIRAAETQGSGRPSIGRPSRQAAKKVESYKEIPLNVKMRRPE